MHKIYRTLTVAILIAVSLCFSDCSPDIDISHEAPAIPVIYSILDKYEPINYVYITKTFIGDGGPLINARINDSLYFPNVKVSFLVAGKDEVWEKVVGQQEYNKNKQEGIFSNPEVQVFSLTKDLQDYDDYQLIIDIPGFSQFSYSQSFLKKPEFVYPQIEGSKISLVPDNPFTVSWARRWNAWNDIKLSFVIITRTNSETLRDTLIYQKTGITQLTPGGPGFSFSFTYDNLLSLFHTYLIQDQEIKNRSFGFVDVEVYGGGGLFNRYMDLLKWQSDYPFSMVLNPDTALGIVSSRSSRSIDSLVLDPASMHMLLNDPKMKKFKFVEW